MKRLFYFVIAGTIWLVLPNMALAAPSFDCEKASSQIEKMICADSKLAAADQKLASTYQAALGRLSSEGAQQFREGQRQWVKYIRTVCDFAASDAQTFKNCLDSEYTNRQKTLDDSARQKGTKLIFYVSRYKAVRSAPPDDYRWTTLEVTYAQIDKASTPSDKALNAKLANWGSKLKIDPNDGTDLYEKVEFSSISPAIISFDIVEYSYEHGSAHGQPSSSTFHWVIGQSRELTAQDVFFDGSKWKEFLRTFCFQAVKHFGFVKSPDDMEGMVEQPSQWILQKKGLGVQFNRYAVASYADGQQKVVIPWDKLKRYLAKDAAAILTGIY